MRSVVWPKGGLRDDWRDVLLAAHDDAGERYERDREPQLHAVLPPPFATGFSRGNKQTDPFRDPRHDSSMFPLWQTRCVAILPRRTRIPRGCSDSKRR